MTKYQQKRAFINKINARIRTLTRRANVDIEHILNRIESIDGVFVNTTGTGINIDTDYFTPELAKRLNDLVPTYVSARERVKSGLNINPDEASRDFIGPNSTEAKTNRLIRTMFSFEDDFERYKEAFYEWRDSQNSARFEANPQAKAIRDKMLEIGNEWYSEPDYNQLADAMRELSKLKY